MLYKIEQEKCTACGLCKKVCPALSAILIEESSYRIDPNECIECGHCAAICPENIITCDGEFLEDRKDINVDSISIRSLIREKRSVRHYKTDIINDTILKELANTAAHTATASNSRHYKLTYLQGSEVALASLKVATALYNIFSKLDNPIVRFISPIIGIKGYAKKSYVKPFKRVLTDTIKGTIDRIFFKAPVVVVISYPKSAGSFGKTDSALAAAHVMLEARTFGLESCVVGYADYASGNKAVAKSLKLDKGMKLGIIFTLGYPKYNYLRVPKRKDLMV
ncbi:MAG: nitroreductase family protein [Spirochaetaceae bacterium]